MRRLGLLDNLGYEDIWWPLENRHGSEDGKGHGRLKKKMEIGSNGYHNSWSCRKFICSHYGLFAAPQVVSVVTC